MEELLTTADVAALLRTSEEWVRNHAADLGGIRLGQTSRAQLRFTPRKVAGYLERQSLERPARRAKARPGPKRAPSGVELFPLSR